MTALRALVQLVHISDMHYSTVRKTRALRTEVEYLHHISARLVPGVKSFTANLVRGLNSHQPRALVRLREVLLAIGKDPQWSAPSILVSSGDHTAWGDLDDYATMQRFLESLVEDGGYGGLVTTYGNHDVWPNRHPAGQYDSLLAGQRDALRNRFFPRQFPIAADPIALASGAVLRLFVVDSVQHEERRNTLARGKVGVDRYWQQSPGYHQLAELESLLRGASDEDINVVVVHHPAWSESTGVPAKLGMWLAGEVMDNAHDFMEVASGARGHRPCDIVLAGHVHEVKPGPGRLPENGSDWRERWGRDSCVVPLTTGTACQAPYDNTPHNAFQVLRLFEDPGEGKILVERSVFNNVAGVGPFRPQGSEQIILVR